MGDRAIGAIGSIGDMGSTSSGIVLGRSGETRGAVSGEVASSAAVGDL